MDYNSFKTFSKKKLALSVAASIALGSGFSTIVLAQDEEETLEEITVTGTRIRSDDFSNAQPSTVLDNEMLDNLGIVNIGDAMASLPSNVGNNTPAASPGGNFFNGANIANLRGLNPFFGSRTLTLVDSRRHVPTNQGDGVDLNFIPSILIERMEVVTGGASASYGSGALSGVTNILLDRDLDGGKIQIDYGESGEGDGGDTHIAFAWGTQVGENGHFIIGVEGQDADEIGSCHITRDWCAKGTSLQTNGGFATNDQPHRIKVSGVRGGLNTVGHFPILGQTFTDASASALRPFNARGAFNVGGEGRHTYAYNQLRSEVDRQIVYTAFDYDFTEDLTFFAEASVGSVDTFSPQSGTQMNFQFINADNYYLNNLAVNPCVGVEFLCFYSKDFSEEVLQSNETTTDMERFTAGLSGRFGDTTWTWDAYYQTGQSDRLQWVDNNQHTTAFQFAADAVPAIPGDYSSGAVCRTTRDGVPPGQDIALLDPRIAEGCQPINMFGSGMMSQQGNDYAFGRLVETTIVNQDMLEGVASGEIFDGWGAGPVRAAVGLSWRDESLENISDLSQPEYRRDDYNIQYGEAFAGEVQVTEFFVELAVPVSEAIDLQLAARESKYENTAGFGTPIPDDKFDHNLSTWKVSGNYQVTDWLRLRGSKSQDIRAPNFRELYYGQDFVEGGPFGWCDNDWTGNVSEGFFTNTGDACQGQLRGGPSLKPETAETTTVGFVLSPDRWNVRFAADHFQIDIEDAITPASLGLTFDGCLARIAADCALITGDLLDPTDPLGGFSDIHTVQAQAKNFRKYEARGFDITADWVGEFDFGTISSRVIGTRMLDQIIQPNANDASVTRDIAGTTGSNDGFLADWSAAPDWTAQWINTYNNGPLTLTSMARWVKEGKIFADRLGPEDSGYSDKAFNSMETNRIADYVVWSLTGSYSFEFASSDMQVFLNVNNLFDKNPPITGSGRGGAPGTFYDRVGRTFRLGLRASF